MTPDNEWATVFVSTHVSNITYHITTSYRQEWVIKISVTSFTLSVSLRCVRSRYAVRKHHQRVIDFVVGGMYRLSFYIIFWYIHKTVPTYKNFACVWLRRIEITYTSMPCYVFLHAFVIWRFIENMWFQILNFAKQFNRFL